MVSAHGRKMCRRFRRCSIANYGRIRDSICRNCRLHSTETQSRRIVGIPFQVRRIRNILVPLSPPLPTGKYPKRFFVKPFAAFVTDFFKCRPLFCVDKGHGVLNTFLVQRFVHNALQSLNKGIIVTLTGYVN